jgi:hypothetical protein
MSVASAVKKLEAQLASLKVEIAAGKKASKPKPTTKAKPKTERKRKDKPKSIDSCETKTDLAKFTIKELKDWIKSNGVETKKLYEKHKADLVELVWKKIKSCSGSECDESSDSEDETDSGSETEYEEGSDCDE